MTVKEAVSVLRKAKDIRIGWNGNSIAFDRNDMLMMDAYGDYIVEEIIGDGNPYEIGIAMRPIKAGECA